jgi:hypothetical protein
MKHTIHLVSLVYLSWVTVPLQAADPYKAIDQRAVQAPPGAETSVEMLAQYLTKTAKNDREKARAIYRWITEHVAYDVPGLLAKKRGDNSPEGVLKNHLCVCEGYARLFQALCEKAEVEAVVVIGRAKPVEFLDDPEVARHAWNAVKLDGEWHLVDPTWGSGGIKDKLFVKKFKDYYFLVPGDELIFNHFPTDPKWQLLPEPKTEKEFDGQPPINPQLFRMGVKPPSLRKTMEGKDFREFVKAYDYPGNPVTIVEAPLGKDLKAGKKYRFRIESSSFQGFLAENQGRQFLFTPKKGKMFEGTVIAPSGPLKIRGVVTGQPGHYVSWTVLEYVGE